MKQIEARVVRRSKIERKKRKEKKTRKENYARRLFFFFFHFPKGRAWIVATCRRSFEIQSISINHELVIKWGKYIGRKMVKVEMSGMLSTFCTFGGGFKTLKISILILLRLELKSSAAVSDNIVLYLTTRTPAFLVPSFPFHRGQVIANF